MKRIPHTKFLIQEDFNPVNSLLMKCQIDKDLDGRGNLLFIREFNRDRLPLRDNRHAVWRHNARLLCEFPAAHAPAVHNAEARADRLVGRVCQTVEDADQHEFSIPLLADVVAEQTGLEVWDHKGL
jgi:hypothetical protein